MEIRREEPLVEEFSRLLVSHRAKIHAFILSLVHDRHHAEDVFQEVAVVLWRKFDGYEIGTNFGAWACRVARLSVFEWRRKQSKLPLPLSDHALELLADDAVQVVDEFDERVLALRNCLKGLRREDVLLLHRRYFEDEPVRAIAAAQQRPPKAIYRKLARVSQVLLDCVRNKLALEEM